jgi:hypothetical protein
VFGGERGAVGIVSFGARIMPSMKLNERRMAFPSGNPSRKT